MGQWAVLQITDGTAANTINLLGAGIRCLEWLPAISEGKGGGVWKDSPLAEGRQLTFRRFGNVVETFKLAISDGSQEAVITSTQNLRRLLEQAISYWMDKTGTVEPVWIEARADCETSSRYALIYDYRTPNDGDPYNGGFVGNPIAFDEWQLQIERGHWLSSIPDSNPTCLPLANTQSNYTYAANLVANYSFETAGGGGVDVFGSWTESAGAGAITQDAASPYHLTKTAKLTAGGALDTYIYQTIAVTAGATYVFSVASMTSVPGAYGVGYPGRYEIYDATHTTDIVPVTTLPYRDTNGFYNFATTFTTPAGCVSIRVYLWCPGSNGAYAKFDYVTVSRITSQTFGKSATCAAQIYLANKSSKGQLTHIYYYDDSAGTYGSNLMLSGYPFDLFPNPMAVNDICYIGIDDGALYNGPFSSVIFDLAQSGTGSLTGAWEYWTGAAWSALTSYDLSTMLRNTGVTGVAFIQPTNWAKTTVNGIYGYWIRFNVSGLGGGVPRPRQQNRKVYTANQAQATITGTDIAGDIPALAKYRVYGVNDSGGTMDIKDLMLYSRCLVKGDRFNPFLNWSDISQESEISFITDSSTFTFANAPDSATGRALWFHPAAAGVELDTMMIVNDPLCNYYFGTFRVFLRVKQTGGSAGDVSISLKITAAATSETRKVYNMVVGSQTFLDFGIFSLPGVPLATWEKEDYFSINLTRVENTNAAGANLLIYDVVMIPTDESAVRAVPQGSLAGVSANNGWFLTLDSTYPKRMIKAAVMNSSYYIIRDTAYQIIASRSLVLQPNQNQVVGLVIFNDADAFLTTYPLAYHRDRYLSMRGNR